jgi:hypothetical protein
MRQDPPQPRAGEQVVEGRLQACRCVPSTGSTSTRSRTWMSSDTHGFIVIMCLLDNDEALSLPYERVVGLLGEDELRMKTRARLRVDTRKQPCLTDAGSPGECETAEVGNARSPVERERVLGTRALSQPMCTCSFFSTLHAAREHVSWAPARSQVLARERVPLGRLTCDYSRR